MGEKDEYAMRLDRGNHRGDSWLYGRLLILRDVPSSSETTKMSRLGGGTAGVSLACRTARRPSGDKDGRAVS